MGFVHYYEVQDWNSTEWRQAWAQLIEDTKLIILAADVPLCGDGGDSQHLDPPIVDVDEGIYLNGIWEDGHETFVFSDSQNWASCKVAGGVASQKPYGTVVACILLRAFILAPDYISVGSDGRWNSGAWGDARELYHSIWPDQTLSCPWAAPGMSHDETKHIVYPAVGTEEQASTATASNHTSLLEEFSRRSNTCSNTLGDLNLGRAIEWLHLCEANHHACRAWPLEINNLPGVEFRLIDVQRRCVIVPNQPVSFLALSYVWGGVEQLKLTRPTERLLLSERSFDDLWQILSTTVRDAIIVCERLGERYLWTDSLCILQDSARDMKVQISWMRQIYSAAKCTIVAVSAKTADIGLLGCHDRDVGSPVTEVELAHFVGSSPWSARAWCYQENALSHRTLLFTSRGIFMQCMESSNDACGMELAGNRHEDASRSDSCGSMLTLPPSEDPLESYSSAVAHYSQRQLSKPEDKLNAFYGILQRYQQVDTGKAFSLHYAIPVIAFDQAFCWRAQTHNPAHRNMNFPSWSWLGWNAPVLFELDMMRKGRTNQMLYFNDEHTTSSEGDWKAARELRKPANSGFLPPEDQDNARFGFPATQHMNTSESSSLWVASSVAKLRISLHPTKLVGDEGCYAVYPTRCTQEPPDPPPKTVSLRDMFTRTGPKMNLMDEETAAAPSIPLTSPVEDDGQLVDHGQHGTCEANAPVGHMWLSREWRDKQHQAFVLEFMAVSGERNEHLPGKWTIKMLMALQRMEKNGHFWARERLQVMDCNIEQQQWLNIRAKTFNLKIV